MASRTAPSFRSVSSAAIDEDSLAPDLFHELANLTAMIRLWAHVNAHGKASSPPDAEIPSLAAQASALIAALRALLGFRHVARSTVAPAEILEALTRALGDRSPSGCHLEVSHPSALPDVRLDAELFHQLLVALTIGALAASGSGQTVRILAAHFGRIVAIAVEDQGPPLPLADDGGQPLRGGRALGVRVAAELLRRAGGRVALQRNGGVNRIELRVPVARTRKAR